MIQDATLANSGTLQSISFYVAYAAGNLRMGLYDATGAGGGPGKLIAQTGSFRPVVGWNTQTLTNVAIPAGNYWLAYTPSQNALTFTVERDHGRCWWANRAYQAMPAIFPRVVGKDECHWGFYVTLSVP